MILVAGESSLSSRFFFSIPKISAQTQKTSTKISELIQKPTKY